LAFSISLFALFHFEDACSLRIGSEGKKIGK